MGLATKLKVGVIGYGYIGRLHARAYSQGRSALLVAVADSDPECADAVPAGVKFYGDYLAVLDSAIDAVSICLPTGLHCQVALEALSRGKHVLLEKPIATTVAEAEQLVAAADRARRILYVGMTHRFYPELREAWERFNDGVIGSLVSCNDCILEHYDSRRLAPWYLDERLAGGGIVLTSGIHLVDRLRWFTGSEITHVAGFAGNPHFGTALEDAAQMYLRFHSGVFAEITFSFLREPHPSVCDLRLVGTRGSLIVHTWKGYELHTATGSREKVFYTNEPHAMKVLTGVSGVLEEFCSSIRENRLPWPSPQDSSKALEAITAFYLCAGTGRFETVKPNAERIERALDGI